MFRQVNNLVKRKGDADEKLRGLTVVSTDMAKCATDGLGSCDLPVFPASSRL